MTEKQGKLKYSEDDKSWYITLENNTIWNSNEKILDIDIKLSDCFIPCAIDLKEGTLTFIETSLNLDNCFEYEIILYIPWKKSVQEKEFNVPF